MWSKVVSCRLQNGEGNVDEHGYKQSLGHTITAFKDELIRLHINCTLRKEHGRDIDGACGQLRAKREKGA